MNNVNLILILYILLFYLFNDGFWSKFFDLLGIFDLFFVVYGNERKNVSLLGKVIKIL